MHVLAAPDKFRGTATAPEIAGAIARACETVGASCTQLPLADGGEGTLVTFGGGNRTLSVTGPLGDNVMARWRLDGDTAVVEMAEASGLVLAGGSAANDPLAATSRGTGELIAEAYQCGASRVIVGVGGSASTDGGLAAVDLLAQLPPLDGSTGFHVMVAKDVDTLFCDAAAVFGPQKGAAPDQVELLTARLAALAAIYRSRYGVDVTRIAGAGAGGGLAGGLAALGATLSSGFDLVAREVKLAEAISAADLVVTGEGRLDRSSFHGKVVGGVIRLAEAAGIGGYVVAGQVGDVAVSSTIIDLASRFGVQRAMTETISLVTSVTSELLIALEDALP